MIFFWRTIGVLPMNSRASHAARRLLRKMAVLKIRKQP